MSSSMNRRHSKGADIEVESIHHHPKSADTTQSSSSTATSSQQLQHGSPEYLNNDVQLDSKDIRQEPSAIDKARAKKTQYFAYIKTKEFWFVLAFGYVFRISLQS